MFLNRLFISLLVYCLLSAPWTSALFLCRSSTTACQGTCTKWPVAASWKWCILGTTRWGSGPPRWPGTDPGPSPLTSLCRTQVSLHLPWRQSRPYETTAPCCLLIPRMRMEFIFLFQLGLQAKPSSLLVVVCYDLIYYRLSFIMMIIIIINRLYLVLFISII